MFLPTSSVTTPSLAEEFLRSPARSWSRRQAFCLAQFLHLGCVERFIGRIKNSHDPPQKFMESRFFQVSAPDSILYRQSPKIKYASAYSHSTERRSHGKTCCPSKEAGLNSLCRLCILNFCKWGLGYSITMSGGERDTGIFWTQGFVHI